MEEEANNGDLEPGVKLGITAVGDVRGERESERLGDARRKVRPRLRR
jgi:hypothetical protein